MVGAIFPILFPGMARQTIQTGALVDTGGRTRMAMQLFEKMVNAEIYLALVEIPSVLSKLR